jgi:hypothetical protein
MTEKDKTYRAIPMSDDQYRIERYMSEQEGYQPIQAVEDVGGKAFWVVPSPMLRVQGKLFSTGNIDECRRIVALLIENDNAKSVVNEQPDEETIVYL